MTKEPMDRDIAMVFQNYALYPHMSVRQNMGYGLKIAKLSKDRDRSKVTPLRRCFSWSRYWIEAEDNYRAGNASVSPWAAQLCANRQCFCLTSRLSNLDAKLRVQMRLEIKALAGKIRYHSALCYP